MKPEIKKIWMEALRSGEFEQGKGYLRIINKYCCLGVLCELHRRAHPEFKWEDGTYIGLGDVLPPLVREWAGLPNANPQIDEEDDSNSLAKLNDTGFSFNLIADKIEDHL